MDINVHTQPKKSSKNIIKNIAIQKDMNDVKSRTSELSQNPSFLTLKEKYLYPHIVIKRRSHLDSKRPPPPKHLQQIQSEILPTKTITQPNTTSKY
jgi:hypothetical protein